MKVKTLSFNFCGLPILNKKKRLELSLNELGRLKPDIIFLQELLFPYDARKTANFLQRLGLKSYYEKKNKIFNIGGLLIASKFAIEEAGFEPFYDKKPLLSVYTMAEKSITKGFLYLTVRIGQKKMSLITTHLRFKPHWEKGKFMTALHQIKEITSFFKDKKNIILGGDFNFPFSAKDNLLWLEQHGFKNVLSKETVTYNPKSFYPKSWIRMGIVDPRQITFDHIFYKGRIKKVKSGVVFNKVFDFRKKKHRLSEHYGIEAVFEA